MKKACLAVLLLLSSQVHADYSLLGQCLQTLGENCVHWSGGPPSIMYIIEYPTGLSYTVGCPDGNGVVIGFGGCASDGPLPPPDYISPRPMCPGRTSGSIVDTESQTVGERALIAGAPFDMVYSSAWAASRTADYKINLPITGTTASSGVSNYNVTVEIANQNIFQQTFANSASLQFSYAWDGVSPAVAPTLGSTTVTVLIQPDSGYSVPAITKLGNLKAKLLGMGGWMPSILNFYDVSRGELIRGDGSIYPIVVAPRSSGHYLVPEADGSVVYEFDSSGRHLYTRTGLIGTTLYTFNYNLQGYLTTIQEPFSRTTTFTRDISGNLTGIISPNGDTTTAVIDVNGMLASLTDPNSETYYFTYYGTGDLLHTYTKPGGQASTFTYDADGRLTQDAHAAGYQVNLSSSMSGNTKNTTQTSSMGRVETSQVTNLLSSSNYTRYTNLPSGAQRIFRETLTSQQSTVASLTTSINYSNDARFGSALRFPSLIQLAGTRSENYSRSVSLNTPTDPFSIATLTTTKTFNGYPSTQVFNGSTKQTTSTSAEGRVSTRTVDTYERPTSDQWASDTPVTYTYTNDKLTSVQQGTRTETIAYDPVTGLVSSVTNPLSQVTSFTYDLAKRPTSVILPDSRVVQYTYDSNGNLTGVTPPGRSLHSFTYTGEELLGQYAPPSLPPLANVNTTYTYNADRQLTQIARADGLTIGFNYNATTGVLQGVTTAAGTYSYSFDTSSEEIYSISTPQGQTTNHNHYNGALSLEMVSGNGNSYMYIPHQNNLLQLSSENISAGGSAAINYTYDKDELLATAGDLTITRGSDTRVSGTTLGTLSDTWGYNSFGEITSYSLSAGGTPVYSYSITRDALGRVSTLSDTVGVTTNNYAYTYDGAARLTDVTENSSALSHYAFDSNSNRTGGNTGATSFSATFDAQDRMTAYNVYSYTYTAQGELLSKTNSLTSEVWTYAYDVFGNLQSVTLPNSTVVSYKIDGFNRRLSRLVNGTVTNRYVYRGNNQIIAEMNAASQLTKYYVYGTRGNVPDYMVYNGDKYRLVTDTLGSVRLVVKASDGTIAQQIDYNELGAVMNDTNPGFQAFGFAGGLYDADTQLIRFGARDYDPMVGRWTSKDPIGFGGGDINLYSYGISDPVNMIDPLGLFTITVSDSGGRGGSTYGGTITITSDSGHTITIPASSWPNPGNPSPGIAPGTYSGTYSPTGHHGGPGIVVNNNGPVPALGPNPNQNGNSIADFIHIHQGASSTNRGSAGCITIQPGTNPFQYLSPGETGTITVSR